MPIFETLIGGGLLGAAGSLLGNIFGSSQSAKNMREQNKFNAEQAQIARDWQESMWNKENEYNKPVNQLARIREAGLSPGLMYGQGGSFAQASVPSASPARAAETQRVYFDPTIALQLALQSMQAHQSVKTQKAQEEAVKEQTRGQRIENDIKQESYDYSIKANKADADYKEYSVLVQKEELQKRGYEAKKAYYQAETIKTELDYLIQEKELNIEALRTNIDNSVKLTNEQLKLMASQETLNYANAMEAKAQATFYRIKTLETKLSIVPQTLGLIQDYKNKIALGKKLIQEGKTEEGRSELIKAQTSFQQGMTDFTRQRTRKMQPEINREELKYATELLSAPLDVIF